MALSEKAVQYFQAEADSFWQWEEFGEVIAVPGANTIIYTAYLKELLDALADSGLPPLGPLLLTIAATNEEGNNSINAAENLLKKIYGDGAVSNVEISLGFEFLSRLAGIPVKYKTGKQRILLVQSLFDRILRQSVDESKIIVNYLKQASPVDEIFTSRLPANFAHTVFDFKILRILSNQFPANDVIIKRLAPLPDLSKEIVFEDEEKTPDVNFHEALIKDDKTECLGLLLKDLWSGLQIPHHHAMQGVQAVGGVSDISNKGDLHRLLVSEFAYDDTLFVSRLANAEALYLNRENPPQRNRLERVFLLDSSIRTWGTPRTLAFAIMLSVAKHPKTTIPVTAYSVGDTCRQIHFSTVHQVIDSLTQLEAGIDCAGGLTVFFKDNPKLVDKEIFFIASPDSIKSNAIHKKLQEHYKDFAYWIYTDAEGNIDVYKRQQNTRKHIQQLQLNLSRIWRKTELPKLPASEVQHDREYPILFPPTSQVKYRQLTDKQGFVITRNNALMRVHSPVVERGWERLYLRLPKFEQVHIGVMSSGEIQVLMFLRATKKITILSVNRNLMKSIEFDQWAENARFHFFFQEDRFSCFDRRNQDWHWTFSLDEELSQLQLPGKSVHWIADTTDAQVVADGLYVPRSGSIFRDVNIVFINEAGNLVLNTLEFRLNAKSRPRLEKTRFLKKQALAKSSSNSRFHFPDGSYLQNDENGIISLRSSDESLSTIYFSSIVGADIGMVAGEDQSGNPYYHEINEQSRNTIQTEKFWQLYMNRFINTILEYGA